MGDEQLVSFLPMEAIGEQGAIRLDSVVTAGEVRAGFTYFEDQDVVIAKITPCFENGKGALVRGLWGGRGFGTTELHVLRPKKNLDPRFLWWITASPKFRGEGKATMLGAGGQKRVTPEFILDYRIKLPSIRVQREIADFLDRETAKIDALIQEKERLLRLLDERRQALITEAVTRGLDPTVPMKPSGLPWLGDIPAIWHLAKLRRFLREPMSYGANEAAEADNPDWPRYIRITDIGENGKLHADTFRSLAPEVAKPYLLLDGDILLARSGATVGKSFLYHNELGEACYAGYLIRARFDLTRVSPEYLYLYLQSATYWSQIRQGSIQSTIENVSAEKYADLMVPIPDLRTQTEVVRQLEELVEDINDHKSLQQGILSTLKERRSSLIHEAVTGQLQFGGAA